MITLKFKLTLASVLIAESSLGLAHNAGHGESSLHHYLASPHHAIVFALLTLAGLGIGVFLVRNYRGTSKIKK